MERQPRKIETVDAAQTQGREKVDRFKVGIWGRRNLQGQPKRLQGGGEKGHDRKTRVKMKKKNELKVWSQ